MSISTRIEAVKKEISATRQNIASLSKRKQGKTLGQLAADKHPVALRGTSSVRLRRTLKGHFGKVTALHWGGDSRLLVSASQDGNLLVWNAMTSNKLQAITLKSSYVMSVGIEQKKGSMVACGGLDNLCTVYRRNSPEMAVEMAGHDGFLSCCRFLSEEEIITSSGDSTCIRWDIARAKPIDTLSEHTADVMFMSMKPDSPATLLTCSVDKTVKLWDIRDPTSSKQTFFGHESDINTVEFMPTNSNCFGTCSEDGTVRLFDIRAYNELACFGTLRNTSSFEETMLTSMSFSRSGRVMYCGDSSGSINAYDTLSDKVAPTFVFQAHEKHVSCLGVSPQGDALCTGCWDGFLKIWA